MNNICSFDFVSQIKYYGIFQTISLKLFLDNSLNCSWYKPNKIIEYFLFLGILFKAFIPVSLKTSSLLILGSTKVIFKPFFFKFLNQNN